MPDRYRLLLVIGAGLGLRQGEALGLSADDIDFEKKVVHVRRQVKMVRAKLCFALPKGRKIRDVPLPSSVARAIRQHIEQFAPVSVTLPGTTRLWLRRRWRRNTGGRGPTASWWRDASGRPSTGTTSTPTCGSPLWPRLA
ncbi:tyrosine-type recombinase/integrase [Streptomyces sp. NPDC004069]